MAGHSAAPADRDVQTILGVRFFSGSVERLLARTLQGGLFVVPSGPGLARLDLDSDYRRALERSDVALTDSGAMVLLWQLRTGRRIPRISGLRFLRALLTTPEFRAPRSTFWVMPSEADARANVAWLRSQDFPTTPDDVYVAPAYGNGALEDPALLAAVDDRRPRFVVLCIGGGVQERLGLFLRESLEYSPAIVCTGAAIAFLSGGQVGIPPWADRLMLGWLFRCIAEPRRYVPRYTRALRLVPLVLSHGARPVVRPGP